MKKIAAGIIGMGFIGGSHIEALRRIGFVELAAVADAVPEQARRKAEEFSVPCCYDNVEALLANPDIEVVHNCTPNNLHFEINRKIIQANKHVFSEKPLARYSYESEQMLKLLAEHPAVVSGVNFCYRMNPLVLEIKNQIKKGVIGKPVLVHGSYLQDWLMYDDDYNWRIDPEISGPSRCVADIGSHWIDLAQTVIDSKIVEVCADTLIAHPIRKKAMGVVESFARNKSDNYEEICVTTEDYATVLVRFANGVRGHFMCSQISAGRKCLLDIEINGKEGSYYWNQEKSDVAWKGNRDTNNEVVMRNPNLMDPSVRPYTYLPAGHPEGWNDAQRNNLFSFYKFIADEKNTREDSCDFATFEEAHYIMKITEAILKSATEKRWVSVD